MDFAHFFFILIGVIIGAVFVYAIFSQRQIATKSDKQYWYDNAQSLQAQLKEQQTTTTVQTQRIQEMLLAHEQTKTTLNQTQTHLQEAQQQANTYALQHQQLSQSNTELQIRLSSLTTKFEAHQNHAQELTTSQQQTNTQLEQLQKERVQHLQQITGLQAALDEKTRAFDDQSQQIQIMQTQWGEQLSHQRQQTSEAERSHRELLQEMAVLQTTLSQKEKNWDLQKIAAEEQKNQLSDHFTRLAQDILDAKTQSLQDSSRGSLRLAMQPFEQSLDGFKKELQHLHHLETQQQGAIRQELSQLKELNRQITQEAHELATALRGQKKTQGNWGELMLENVLERAGLQLGKDFKREVTVTNANDARLRPDVVVYLPQNKHLIIDAKVSLNAYTDYVNAQDDASKNLALQAHTKAISNRIDDLASKEYAHAKELNSPEVVFMFIPIESAFVEAIKADETIFQKALAQNILVATPTTLLTGLNIVRQLWRFEEQNKHTALLAGKADDVFQKLRTFLNSFQNIKKHLDKACESYQTSENQLINGRGNLIKQVNEFKNLAPSIQNQLPADLVEKALLEIDYPTP